MTNNRWIKREKDFLEKEFHTIIRHFDFIRFAEIKQKENINWDCYWSWYYHSDITPMEAYNNCFEE